MCDPDRRCHMIRLHTPTYSTDVARSLAGGLLTFDAIAKVPIMRVAFYLFAVTLCCQAIGVRIVFI